MCAKPEPTEFFRPLNELHQEFMSHETNALPTFAWAGITAYYGLLENI